MSCLDEARFGIVFASLGSARDCLEIALEYSRSREVFKRPVGGHPLTQQKLADMALELQKGFLLARHLGRLKDAGRLPPARSVLASSTMLGRRSLSRGSAALSSGGQRHHVGVLGFAARQ